MNICIDGRVLQELQYSGVSNYTHQLLDALFKIDRVNTYYIVYTGFRTFQPTWSYPNVIPVHIKIPNKIVNAFFLFRAVSIEHLCWLLKIPVPDCVWVPNHNFWLRVGNVPHVLTVHDLSSFIFPELFSFKQRLWHRLIHTRYLAKVSSGMICVSENTKADTCRLFGTSTEKVHVIYPGINAQRSDGVNPHEKPYILFVGNVESRKNVDAALDAFLEYKQNTKTSLEFVVLGGIHQKNIKERYRFHPSIHFIGYVNDTLKDQWYRHAVALVYPSLYEGFGFPPLEAAFHGIPVITSHAASLSEVGYKDFILVDPYNITDLVQAYGIAVQQGRVDRHATKYSWHSAAQKTLAILKQYAHRN